MLMKPKKAWLKSYHNKYGYIEDREYDVAKEDVNAKMWEGSGEVLKKSNDFIDTAGPDKINKPKKVEVSHVNR